MENNWLTIEEIDGEVVLTKCSKEATGEIVIPDGVTKIGDYAFEKCMHLTSIVIPGSVKSIGSWAFFFCSDLTSITIPDSVKSIGERAFYECFQIACITIPETIISLDLNESSLSRAICKIKTKDGTGISKKINLFKTDLKEIILNFISKNDYNKPLMIIVIYKTNYKSNKYSSIYNNNSNLALDACRHWMVDELKAYWFQDNPLRGHTYFIDVDGQHKRVDDHPELLEAIPKGADHSPVLLYYSYYEQLDPQKLKYAVALGRKLQKPTICLINDYVYNESNKENLNLSDFDVVFYDASYNPKYWKDWLE